MSISNEFTFVNPAEIKLDRTVRQRKVIDTKGLIDSIKSRGIINPLVVTRDFVLVAGERRLTCALELSLPTVPVRFMEDLDPIELQLVELEENLKRSDLTWREQVAAVANIHQLYTSKDPAWNQTSTAESIGLDAATISVMLRVFRDLNSPIISAATTYTSAYNLLARVDSRKTDEALAELLEGADPFVGDHVANAPTLPAHGGAGAAGMTLPPPTLSGATTQRGTAPHHATPAPPPIPASPAGVAASLQHADFTTWLTTYSGPKFNFVHCDFPYGVNVFGGAQAHSGGAVEGSVAESAERFYDDAPEVYWNLLETFCTNLDSFMAHSAHLMFWFSIQHLERTLETFRRLAPSIDINPYPLIWVKSDNRGILPDPKRGPRQIYETALIGSRNDRLIIRSVSNAYSAPSDKTYHHSTKPEPMLRYFFQMFVDDTTQLLDPTCGSGSAIRAAESLGAKHVLGLERNEDHVAAARDALRRFRLLKGV